MSSSVRAPIGVIVTALALFAAPVADAHVVLDKNEAPAASYFKAVLLVPHGCDGQPTTRIRLQLPDDIYVARPQQKPGWSVEIVKKALEKPVAGPHGKTITEKITDIIWSGGNLPDEFYEEFGVIVKLPDQPSGTKIAFPVIQQCAKGEHQWVAQPGATSGDPAPILTLTPKK